MNATLLEASAFIFIAGNFIVCVVAVALPWLREAFHKHPHHEAVILQFARPERKGRVS